MRKKLAPELTTTIRLVEAERKIRHAMELVEQAQNTLDRAAQQLCPVVGGVKLWEQTARLSERCRNHWGKLARFASRGGYGLDYEPPSE